MGGNGGLRGDAVREYLVHGQITTASDRHCCPFPSSGYARSDIAKAWDAPTHLSCFLQSPAYSSLIYSRPRRPPGRRGSSGGPFTTFLALSPVLVSRNGICPDMRHGKWCKGRLNGERARPARWG